MRCRMIVTIVSDSLDIGCISEYGLISFLKSLERVLNFFICELSVFAYHVDAQGDYMVLVFQNLSCIEYNMINICCYNDVYSLILSDVCRNNLFSTRKNIILVGQLIRCC